MQRQACLDVASEYQIPRTAGDPAAKLAEFKAALAKAGREKYREDFMKDWSKYISEMKTK